tara:strand:+ start:63 stop:320 length:258 start_codon:yes stop_codon:yes gene_type:complete
LTAIVWLPPVRTGTKHDQSVVLELLVNRFRERSLRLAGSSPGGEKVDPDNEIVSTILGTVVAVKGKISLTVGADGFGKILDSITD